MLVKYMYITNQGFNKWTLASKNKTVLLHTHHEDLVRYRNQK